MELQEQSLRVENPWKALASESIWIAVAMETGSPAPPNTNFHCHDRVSIAAI